MRLIVENGRGLFNDSVQYQIFVFLNLKPNKLKSNPSLKFYFSQILRFVPEEYIYGNIATLIH